MTARSLARDLDDVAQFLEFAQDRNGDAWQNFLDGWSSLLDIRESLPLIVNVSLAIVLTLGLVNRVRKSGALQTLKNVKETRALVMYAAVSAAIAVLVVEHPVMALVVFGMGGLMRFRTPSESGESTARAVFAIVIGLASGLGLYALAILATAIAYLGVNAFLTRYAIAVSVRKLAPEQLDPSQAEYQSLFQERGCRIGGVRRYPDVGEFSMIVWLPRGLSPSVLYEDLQRRIPEDLRGKLRVEVED